MKKILMSLFALMSLSFYCQGEQQSLTTTECLLILKPSAVSGVGVFATRDIPQGTLIYSGNFSYRIIKVQEIPVCLRQYTIRIGSYDEKSYDEYRIAPQRFDHMEIDWYINHSADANAQYQSSSMDTMGAINNLYAIQDIKAGDEIFVNYSESGAFKKRLCRE